MYAEEVRQDHVPPSFNTNCHVKSADRQSVIVMLKQASVLII